MIAYQKISVIARHMSTSSDLPDTLPLPRTYAVADGMDAGARIDDILAQCTAATGIDLSQYKPHTLIRRLEQRVLATEHSDITSYLSALTENTDEAAALRREMMIPVSGFFRDRDAFEDLRSQVIAPAFAALAGKPAPVFRAWVVACATGQEAYTLAILAHEEARALHLNLEIKIFATDIEPSYLETASAGRYSAHALNDLPEGLKARYFTPLEDGFFQISPKLRRCIVFSQHDALYDPPFLNLDLVSCRNMIIYLNAGAQDRVLKRLLFGLRAGGTLFLGSSESLGSLSGLLDNVCARTKIFRLKERLRRLTSADIVASMVRRNSITPRPRVQPRADLVRYATPALSPALSTIIAAYAPPSVVIDGTREIRHVFGDVSAFVHLMPGQASLDLVQLFPARTGAAIGSLIAAAFSDQSDLASVVLHPADDPDFVINAPVRISVRPVRGSNGHHATDQLLVSFEHMQPDAIPPQDGPALATDRTQALERDLNRLRAALQSTLEDLGSTNDDLQSSNEELLASNEELQSINEELQSVNAELHTVNLEFQTKIVQLNEAYADLDNLSRAARIPLIFLDRNLCVTRFSAQATDLFRLRDLDLGRPLSDITNDLDLPHLTQQVQQALDENDTIRAEVPGHDGRTWLVTIQPFFTKDREAARIVLSFIDVTSMQVIRHLQDVLDALPHGVAILDSASFVTQVNAFWRGAALAGGANPLITDIGINYLDMLRDAPPDATHLHSVLEGLTAILSAQRSGFSLKYRSAAAPEQHWFMIHASGLRGGGCVITHVEIADMYPQSLLSDRQGHQDDDI